MSEQRKRQHNPLDDPQRFHGEPVHLPSQAEGGDGDEDEETPLDLRTGGQAEGTEEAVEDQLQRQEQKNRLRR